MIDVPAWMGFDKLLEYYNQCKTKRHEGLFATLFETGGRVSEVIDLKPEQFNWNEEALVIAGMLVKKYRKRMRRDIYIKRDEQEPLAEELISFVKDCKTDYLFPRTAPFSGEVIVPNIPTSTTQLYLLVRQISPDLWPHWFRSQRASYLVYVRDFNAFEIKDWFGWKSMDSAGHYVKGKAMAKKLGIEKLPGLPKPEPKKVEPKKEKIIDRYEELRKKYVGE